MDILGTSTLAPSAFGHDVSVAILDDNYNLFAISEVMLTSIKHDGGHP